MSARILDKVNSGRIIQTIKKNLQAFMTAHVGEPNDGFTRRVLRETFEEYLEGIVAHRGVASYRVICDETNNPSGSIDRSELNVDVMITPVGAVNHVVINGRMRTEDQVTLNPPIPLRPQEAILDSLFDKAKRVVAFTGLNRISSVSLDPLALPNLADKTPENEIK